MMLLTPTGSSQLYIDSFSNAGRYNVANLTLHTQLTLPLFAVSASLSAEAGFAKVTTRENGSIRNVSTPSLLVDLNQKENYQRR